MWIMNPEYWPYWPRNNFELIHTYARTVAQRIKPCSRGDTRTKGSSVCCWQYTYTSHLFPVKRALRFGLMLKKKLFFLKWNLGGNQQTSNLMVYGNLHHERNLCGAKHETLDLKSPCDALLYVCYFYIYLYILSCYYFMSVIFN